MADKQKPRMPDEKIRTPGVPTMGLREYARHRGLSHTAIAKAIASGRIAAAVHQDSKGWPRIDAAKADPLMDSETDASAQRPKESRRGGSGAPAKPPGPDQPLLFGEVPARQAPPPPAAGLAGVTSWTQARAIRENYDARLRKLEYEREIGRLVSADEGAGVQMRLARMLREQLLWLPGNVAKRYAAETNAHAIEENLTLEIERVLTNLADAGKTFL